MILDQSGKILLCPAATGQVEIHGNLLVQGANSEIIALDISEQGILIRSPSGVQIQLDRRGNIDFTPAAQGNVRRALVSSRQLDRSAVQSVIDRISPV